MGKTFQEAFENAARQGRATLEVEYWRCESHRGLHFNANIDVWEYLKKALSMAGYNVKEKELKIVGWGPVQDCDIHRWQEVVKSLHTVQGLEYHEYCQVLPALESLIEKYAALK